MVARDTAGYSGTPLAKKLGIKEASRVWLRGAPAGYGDSLQPLPGDVTFERRPGPRVDIAHVFVSRKVCAVTDVWSGLKLVVRKELRKGS